ncbi:MAG: aminoacyl-tRNA hydrolase [Chlamydiae bacterium]|nr:aminoacyl-tRNA hydrolase [Chlamydiota bacterium]
MFLIVGLGNPTKEFENTRHNVGFDVVTELAKKHGLTFKNEKRLKGKLAKGNILGEEVVLLLPMTYMNLSGEAVKLALDFYKIELDKVLVVADDVDIPLGELRIKKDSGSGGHKGLENIELVLSSKGYVRLKVGIGRGLEDIKDFVLGHFTQEEKEKLNEIIKKAMQAIEIWLKDGALKAAGFANVRKLN